MRRRRRIDLHLVKRCAIDTELPPRLFDLDKTQPPVVENNDRQSEILPKRRGEFPARHLETAVTEQTDHG